MNQKLISIIMNKKNKKISKVLNQCSNSIFVKENWKKKSDFFSYISRLISNFWAFFEDLRIFEIDRNGWSEISSGLSSSMYLLACPFFFRWFWAFSQFTVLKKTLREASFYFVLFISIGNNGLDNIFLYGFKGPICLLKFTSQVILYHFCLF